MKNFFFTVCTGRCGQATLVNYINKFSTNTFSEVEPPETFFQGRNIISRILQNIEREFFNTDEMLGRGKFLEFYDKNNLNPIQIECQKKIKRINNILFKKNKINYFEVSKFFIRSYGEELIKINPNMKILYLYRNPIINAKSFLNRKKNFQKDNFLPSFLKTQFNINIESLNEFEKYLWCWIEVKLRMLELKKKYNQIKIYNFKTEDLNKLDKIKNMFDFFNIKYENLSILNPSNTNEEQGRNATVIAKNDLEIFLKFLKKIPEKILSEIPEFAQCYSNTKIEN